MDKKTLYVAPLMALAMGMALLAPMSNASARELESRGRGSDDFIHRSSINHHVFDDKFHRIDDSQKKQHLTKNQKARRVARLEKRIERIEDRKERRVENLNKRISQVKTNHNLRVERIENRIDNLLNKIHHTRSY